VEGCRVAAGWSAVDFDVDFDFDFNILTALKGWVGQAAKRTGDLHIIIILLLLF
jgi:hypothetical protein